MSSSTSSALRSSSSSSVNFVKYHGLGNDFILIDNRDQSEPSLTPSQSERLCDRNFGIGGDGVIFALRPSEEEEDYDFQMRIYNSDGSEPEMCGNGIRCMAQFLHDLGEDAQKYKIETLAGPIPTLNTDTQTITVDMGKPSFLPSTIPTTLQSNHPDGGIVDQNLICNNKTWKVTCVSMGNPHAVIFVENDLETDIDFENDGPALECCEEAFPSRTNVEFVQVMSDDHLVMKVWERGAGPTLACGTGACALVVAAIRAGRIKGGNEVRVTLPGGDLMIEWKEDGKVYMTGPAQRVFEGVAVLDG